MKKWVLMILGLLMMLMLAVPAMAQTGEPDATQNAGTVSAPYTVEFTYDGNQYVMPGDSSVRLSAVLDEVGLTGEAEAVAVSDESLFSASNATGEWIVTAHRAFDTDEWMKVMINGVVYEITVTDTQSPYGHIGSGTAADPWQIATVQQWQDFAQNMVNVNNSTYGDNYYKLTADITVETTDTSAIFVGGSTKPFRGHFDGGGHTLTFNYRGMVGGAAPFRYVNGATIENLKVTGTISDGNIYAAGIAGYVTGNTTISNCTSSVTISSSHSGSGHFGGLVGSVESWVTLTINNCLFNGSMTQSGSFTSGGFVGYNLGTVNITDCLCAPGSIGVGMYSFVYDFAGGSSTLIRAYSIYYNSTYKNLNQGTRAYNINSAPVDKLTKKVTAIDNNVYWLEGIASITGISASYELFGASMELPPYQVTFDGVALSSSDYDAAYTNSSGETVSSITVPDTYTITVSGKGDYAGSISKSFEVSGHKITILSAQHGMVTADQTTAAYNSTVTLTVTPESAQYKVLGLSVKDTAGKDITVTNNGFTMPDCSVTVSAVFGLAETDIYYIDSDGEVKTPPADVSALAGNNTTLLTGWYLASGKVTILERVSVKGVVHLILKDGAEINIPKGITVENNDSLFIYGQANDSGKLTVSDPSLHEAGIGGTENKGCGTVVINGGTIDVKGGFDNIHDDASAAIGGGNNGNGGNITINGGVINADARTNYAAGIGGGSMGGGGNITINGGMIHATGGNKAAGIGDGYNGNGATVSLSWKKITDSIYANSYSGTITFDKAFVLSSNENAATESNIGGQTIIPAYAVNIANTENGTVSAEKTVYRYGRTVTLTVTPNSGYEISSVKYGSTEIAPVAGAYSFEMPANDVTVSATFSPIPATAPTITAQPENLDLLNGADSGNVLTVAAEATADHTLSYQWYSNTINSNEGGSVINNATSASYTVPTNTDGTTYYYCVVTATHTNNQTAATISRVAAVKVTTKTAQTISFDNTTVEKTYGDAAFANTATGAHTTVTYSSGNTNVATVDGGTGEVTIVGAGEATITATAATDETYQEATASYALTVNRKSVTITGLTVSNKIYDGNTTATVSGTAAIDGRVGNDDVTVTAGTAAFTDKNVGTDKTVTFSSYAISGTAKDNYTLSAQPASVTANITPKEVSVGSGITAGNKTYDGTTTATINCSGASFTGLVENDALTISGVAGTFSDENIGNGIIVTLNYSSAVLGGSVAWNYVLATGGQQASTTANITAKPITITANGQSVELKGAIAMGTDKVSISSGELASGHSLHSVSIALAEGKNTNNAGEYDSAIVPSGAVIWNASSEDVTANYAITYVNGKLTVTKAKARVTTAPTAITGLTYTGTGQQLITAGEADTAMEYALGENADTAPTTGYGDTVPSGKDAKSSYYVWYRAKADANHDASEPAVVTASIGKATINSVAVSGINTPKATENLDTEATTDTTGVTLNNSGTITWNPAAPQDGKAEYAKAYTAAMNATSAENYTFADTVTATVNGQSANATKNDDGTLTISYTFGKTALNPVTITAANKEVTYSADGIAIPVEGMFTIPEGAGAATYAVENGTGVGTYDAQTGKLTVTKCGTITIKVSTAESDTHAAGPETTATLTVNKANNPATIAATVSVMKSGSSAELVNNVDLAGNVTLNGATGAVNYVISGDANGCTLSGSVLTIGSNTGTVTVNVTVEADDNYNPLAVTPIAVTITNKQTQTIAAESMTVTYGDTDKSVSASVNEPATGGGAISYAVKDGSTDYIDVDASTGALTIKKAGTATVIVTAAETSSYAQATKEVTVTINTKAMTVNASGYTGYVDQTAHGITVTVTDPASGYTVNYGTVEGTYDQTTSPTRTEVGTLTVYYQVTADNYITKTGSATVTISEKQPATVTKVPTAKDLTYTGSPQALVSAGTAEGGEMQYALGTETEATQPYTTSIPTGIEAGTYYVWYKLIGDANHLDLIVLRPIAVTIAAEGGSESKIVQRSLNRVPAELAGLYGNVEEIRQDMLLKVRINGEPVRAESTFLFDVALQVSFDGGKTWQPATEENFPAEGLQVMLPYPAGTNGKDFDFAVSHMFTITSTRLGTTVGGIETPVVTKTEDGLLVVFRGLSPVLVSWARKGENSDPSPTVTPVPLPKTGDGANPALWLTLMILGIGAVVFLLLSARRKEDR